MRLALTAFTRRGAALARQIAAALEGAGHTCALALPSRLADGLGETGYGELQDWTGTRFAGCDGLIFVGAFGIAVRAIAPFVRDKLTDPCVVGVDEAGRFAIPLLSGHVGGGNDLARQIAALTGGTAAVSTATDLNGRFSVDQWAARAGMALGNRDAIKRISAALLEGEPVGFASAFPVAGALPAGVMRGAAETGFWVSVRTGPDPFPITLRLRPRILRLGIGCRRGIPADAVAAAADSTLAAAGLDAAAVEAVCTIDRKGDEAGLLAFCRRRGLPLRTYSAQALAALAGDFTPSDFVAETVGVDNVCERAAVMGGARLLVAKTVRDGVTVAVAQRPFVVTFEQDSEEESQ